MNGEYRCNAQGCNKSFNSLQALHGHMSVHKENDPKQCPKCNRIFSSEGGLRIHMSKKHGGWEYHPGIDLNRLP